MSIEREHLEAALADPALDAVVIATPNQTHAPMALQALADHGLVESRRGLGIFVTAGARERLLRQEREQFLQKDWPALRAKLKRLGLTAKDLNWEST